MGYIAKHKVVAAVKGKQVSFEPGKPVEGLNEEQIERLLARGAIKKDGEKAPAKPATKPASKPAAKQGEKSESGDGLD